MIDPTRESSNLQPNQTQQNQQGSSSPSSEVVSDVVKSSLGQIAADSSQKKNVKDSSTEIKSDKIEYLDISQDYLSKLPTDMLVEIAALCDFQGRINLSQCSSKLREVLQGTCFKKPIDSVCCRFEALYEENKKGEVSIPKDAIALYDKVNKYRRY